MRIAGFLRADSWKSGDFGPLYLQLRRRIEEGIASGALPPATHLPSEREIAALTGLSRVTVRKAIGDLVARGVVVQRQGSGSYIADTPPRVEQSLSRLTSFTEDMARRGLEVTSAWLNRGIFTPSPDETVALGLSAGDSVARVSRLRRARGRPMAIERAALPTDILPDPAAVVASLYDVLERSGHRPVRAIQKISAVTIESSDADLLQVAPGGAGLRIERTSYLAAGRVVEFTRSLYRGDAYDFVAELRLAPQKGDV